MKFIFIILSFFISSCSAPTQKVSPFFYGNDWLYSENHNKIKTNSQEIKSEDFFEVVPTKLVIAIDRLAHETVIPIDCKLAKYYAGHLTDCEPKMKYFLVRSVYGRNIGTGEYSLVLNGDTADIHFSFLGKSTAEPSKGAIVIKTTKEIRNVHPTVSAAL